MAATYNEETTDFQLSAQYIFVIVTDVVIVAFAHCTCTKCVKLRNVKLWLWQGT